MSGAFLGVQPVVVPDYGATLARAQQYGINHLAALAQLRQMQQQEGQENALATLLPALTEADPARRLAALAGIGRYLPNVALPLLQKEHEQAEWRAIAQPAPATPAGGAPAAAEAAPASAPGGAASLPRGLRNNNPLNIEAGAFTQGQPGFQGSDGRFARFASLEDGLAAADRLLQSYAARGLTTPLAIVSRWAPAGDGNNNPQAYAAAVARQLGVAPDAPLDMSDPEVRRRVALAMAQVENGRPLPSGAGASPAASVPDLPAVPGFDMDRVRRAMANQHNPLAKAYLDSYYNAVRLLVRPETAPRSPERFRQDLELAERQAARTNVNIDQRGQTSYDQTRGKELAERVSAWESAGMQAAQTLRRLDRMERAIEAFPPGALSTMRITAGQLAQQLGVPDSILAGLGIDRSRVAEGEAIRSLQMQLLTGLLGSGQFPSNNFSNADREALERSLPGLQSSPGGNRAVIALLRAGAQREMEVARAWREWASRNGDSLDSARRFQMEVLPEIVNRDVLAPILAPFLPAEPAAAAGPAPAPGPGGRGIAEPPPAPPPPPPPPGFRVVR